MLSSKYFRQTSDFVEIRLENVLLEGRGRNISMVCEAVLLIWIVFLKLNVIVSEYKMTEFNDCNNLANNARLSYPPGNQLGFLRTS